jgi:uncharacterized membrane protein
VRIEPHPSERVRVVVAFAVAVIVAAATAFVSPWELAVLSGWDASSVVLLAWIWWSIARLDARRTHAVATREDDSRAAAFALLLVACTISLVVVIFAFAEAERRDGALELLLDVSGVTGVLLSWAVVHTVFTLRYVHLFYSHEEEPGGITFSGESASPSRTLPDYGDFAYLAFTVGMTFQVSDTEVTTKEMRRAVLHHALLSWLFGAIIVATTINLLAAVVR